LLRILQSLDASGALSLSSQNFLQLFLLALLIALVYSRWELLKASQSVVALVFLALLKSLLTSSLRSESSLLHQETLAEVSFSFMGQLALNAVLMASVTYFAATSRFSAVWNLDGAFLRIASRSNL